MLIEWSKIADVIGGRMHVVISYVRSSYSRDIVGPMPSSEFVKLSNDGFRELVTNSCAPAVCWKTTSDNKASEIFLIAVFMTVPLVRMWGCRRQRTRRPTGVAVPKSCAGDDLQRWLKKLSRKHLRFLKFFLKFFGCSKSTVDGLNLALYGLQVEELTLSPIQFQFASFCR